jgi:hypothetical protein
MLGSLKRLFSPRPEGHDFTAVEAWAKEQGHGFKRARREDGFVIDGLLGNKPWRIEWGPSQRSYIEGHELRLRIELALRSDTQMLLLSRELMAVLERKTFEEFTDSVQTQIGTKTPEEMRWLVMFPKIDLAPLKALKAPFGAVASTPALGLAWIDGPLALALERASAGLLKGAPPFVLMTLRGNAYMKLRLRSPDVDDIAAALALFETAATQAVRAAGEASDKTSDWGSTASSTWESLKPDDIADPRRRR